MKSDLDRYVDDIAVWEGLVLWMYLDKKGLVTTGIGNLLSTTEAARALPWFYGNVLATPEQVTGDWMAVVSATRGKPAHAYASLTRCRLTAEFTEAHARGRLEHEFLPGCRRVVTGFDELPLAARRALVDMIYSLGERGLASYGNMLHCIDKRDWHLVATESHRKGARDDRNKWVEALFRSCAIPVAA